MKKQKFFHFFLSYLLQIQRQMCPGLTKIRSQKIMAQKYWKKIRMKIFKQKMEYCFETNTQNQSKTDLEALSEAKKNPDEEVEQQHKNYQSGEQTNL